MAESLDQLHESALVCVISWDARDGSSFMGLSAVNELRQYANTGQGRSCHELVYTTAHEIVPEIVSLLRENPDKDTDAYLEALEVLAERLDCDHGRLREFLFTEVAALPIVGVTPAPTACPSPDVMLQAEIRVLPTAPSADTATLAQAATQERVPEKERLEPHGSAAPKPADESGQSRRIFGPDGKLKETPRRLLRALPTRSYKSESELAKNVQKGDRWVRDLLGELRAMSPPCAIKGPSGQGWQRTERGNLVLRAGAPAR